MIILKKKKKKLKVQYLSFTLKKMSNLAKSILGDNHMILTILSDSRSESRSISEFMFVFILVVQSYLVIYDL